MHAYLALGDSYSIGEGVAATARWPVQLAARLRARGIALGEPRIIATTGWTTDELAAAMDATTFAPPCALVSLMIGVNDQYRGHAPEQMLRTFERLLRRAIALAGDDSSRVLVPSIPDWGATPFGFASGRDRQVVSAQIDACNHGQRECVQRHGAHWIDVTAASRAMADEPALVADDGLHPSATMHQRWVELIAPVAQARLAATAVSGGAGAAPR